MKWIVFALGLVLAVCGLTAIWQGYGIVQVERGWTLVISGATALGAGIVTIALGVVVARVESLLVQLAKQPILSAKQRDILPTDFSMSGAAAAAPAAFAEAAAAAPPQVPTPTVEPALAPELAPTPAMAGVATFDIPPRQEAKEPDRPFKSPDFRRLRTRVGEEAAAPEPVPPAPIPGRTPKVARQPFVMPPAMPARSVPTPGAWPAEPNSSAQADAAPARPNQSVPPTRAQPAKVDAAPPNEKSEHDWLELALAGIESEDGAKPKPEAKLERGELSVEAALVAAVEEEIANHGQYEPAAVAEVKEEPANPAIVGRYELNGASYALFADGTIEAATANGIYRFANMAELKEFIEAGA